MADGTAPASRTSASDAVAQERRLESRSIAAGWVGFVVGLVAGLVLLAGDARPIAGPGSLALPAAAVAAVVTAAAFATSTLLHRRDETAPMPGWQRLVSNVSGVALTIAVAVVAALGVLAGAEVLALGLVGFDALPIFGAALTAVPSAAGAWLAFQAGATLRTRDLATLLFVFLAIGTVLAMLTADDARWWERNFSQLGIGSGPGAWAFNGTIVVAGLLVVVIGLYVGRDLHRWLGDAALRRIAAVVIGFAASGALLAGVGLFPLPDARLAHNISAFGTIGAFAATAVLLLVVLPERPRALVLTTAGLGLGVGAALLLWRPLGLINAAALEAVAVGLAFVWMTTLVRTLAALVPGDSRPAATRTPLHPERTAAPGSTPAPGAGRVGT